MNELRKLVLIGFFAAVAIASDVHLPCTTSDHMVLMRARSVPGEAHSPNCGLAPKATSSLHKPCRSLYSSFRPLSL